MQTDHFKQMLGRCLWCENTYNKSYVKPYTATGTLHLLKLATQGSALLARLDTGAGYMGRPLVNKSSGTVKEP